MLVRKAPGGLSAFYMNYITFCHIVQRPCKVVKIHRISETWLHIYAVLYYLSYIWISVWIHITEFIVVVSKMHKNPRRCPEHLSHHKISPCLEARRFGFNLFQSLWNLTGTSAAALPRRLTNFVAIRSLWYPISRFRDFKRSCCKTSYRLVNRSPGSVWFVNSSHSKFRFLVRKVCGYDQIR